MNLNNSWRSDLYSNLVSIKTIVLLGILLCILFIIIFLHPDQPDEWWRNGGEDGVSVITELKKKLNEMNANDPQFIEKKRILMLREYEWDHIDDLKRYKDNKVLIMPDSFLIPLLCFYFAVLVKKRSNILKTKWDALKWVWQSLIISMVFAILLTLIQVLFSLWMGKVYLDFEGFFRSVFLLDGEEIVEVPGWQFLLITRGLTLIQIAVFCTIGIFIRSICKRNGVASILLVVITLLYIYSSAESLGKVDYFIFYKHILYRYVWGNIWGNDLEGGTIWLGLFVHIAWFLIFFIGAGWIIYRNREKTEVQETIK